MARFCVLSNGQFLVGMDNHGFVRDVYYPYVGEENHVNGKIHRVGISVNKSFSWLSEARWQVTVHYYPESLVSQITYHCSSLGLHITAHDVVDKCHNIFVRKFTVRNEQKESKKIKLFFHQIFEIYGSSIGNTAFFNPFLRALVHYKGRRYFLINAQFEQNGESLGISSYATGLSGEFGYEGTFKDAEDTILSKHPIEHGSVDSVLSVDFELAGESSQDVYYWMCAGKDLGDVSQLNGYITKTKPEQLLKDTKKHWINWVNRTQFDFHGLDEKIVTLFKRSLLIIKAQCDERGAIIASTDSDVLFLRRDTYSYMWPRDGALVARSLDRSGYFEITEQFFDFCNRVLTPFGYLFHKYQSNGAWGSSWHPWVHEGRIQLPIQEDQIGLVLDALWKHYSIHGQKEYAKKLFEPFILKVKDFLLDFIDPEVGLPKESYDLWEEKLGIHTFTCCAVYAGLKAAEAFEIEFGADKNALRCEDVCEKLKKNIIEKLYDTEKKCFIKRLYWDGGNLIKDTTFDSSSPYGIFHFNVLDVFDTRVEDSFEYFKKALANPTYVGGYARYVGDNYRRTECTGPGNPWFITSLWLAEYYIARAKKEEDLKPAIEIFKWVTDYALSSGVLSEQLNPCSGLPLSVAPLTWSHAAFVIAIVKYLEKLNDLGICEMCSPVSLKNSKEKE